MSEPHPKGQTAALPSYAAALTVSRGHLKSIRAEAATSIVRTTTFSLHRTGRAESPWHPGGRHEHPMVQRGGPMEGAGHNR